MSDVEKREVDKVAKLLELATLSRLREELELASAHATEAPAKGAAVAEGDPDAPVRR